MCGILKGPGQWVMIDNLKIYVLKNLQISLKSKRLSRYSMNKDEG